MTSQNRYISFIGYQVYFCFMYYYLYLLPSSMCKLCIFDHWNNIKLFLCMKMKCWGLQPYIFEIVFFLIQCYFYHCALYLHQCQGLDQWQWSPYDTMLTLLDLYLSCDGPVKQQQRWQWWESGWQCGHDAGRCALFWTEDKQGYIFPARDILSGIQPMM